MKIERSQEWWMRKIEQEGDAEVGAGAAPTTTRDAVAEAIYNATRQFLGDEQSVPWELVPERRQLWLRSLADAAIARLAAQATVDLRRYMRYKLWLPEESFDGPWVRYDDVAPVIAALTARAEAAEHRAIFAPPNVIGAHTWEGVLGDAVLYKQRADHLAALWRRYFSLMAGGRVVPDNDMELYAITAEARAAVEAGA